MKTLLFKLQACVQKPEQLKFNNTLLENVVETQRK